MPARPPGNAKAGVILLFYKALSMAGSAAAAARSSLTESGRIRIGGASAGTHLCLVFDAWLVQVVAADRARVRQDVP